MSVCDVCKRHPSESDGFCGACRVGHRLLKVLIGVPEERKSWALDKCRVTIGEIEEEIQKVVNTQKKESQRKRSTAEETPRSGSIEVKQEAEGAEEPVADAKEEEEASKSEAPEGKERKSRSKVKRKEGRSSSKPRRRSRKEKKDKKKDQSPEPKARVSKAPEERTEVKEKKKKDLEEREAKKRNRSSSREGSREGREKKVEKRGETPGTGSAGSARPREPSRSPILRERKFSPPPGSWEDRRGWYGHSYKQWTNKGRTKVYKQYLRRQDGW